MRSTVAALLLSLCVCASPSVQAMAAKDDRNAESGSVPLTPRGASRSVRLPVDDSSSWTRTIAALGFVIVILGVGLKLAKKHLPAFAQEPGLHAVQVLNQTSLGTRGSIYLVRCGPRVLIIGASSGHLTTLAEIADPDEIDEYVRLCGAKPASHQRSASPDLAATTPTRDLKGQVHGMLDKIDVWKTSA